VIPIAIEVWTLLWRSDQSHVGSERGSHVPVHCARSCLSYRWEWVPWWGPLWLSTLPEGSTCPPSEAKVRQRGPGAPVHISQGLDEAEIVPDGV
jgi:hypothetical protein